MSRAFITGFAPNNKGFMQLHGFVHNQVTDFYFIFMADQVPYDYTSATPIRTQLQNEAASQVNLALTLAGHGEEANIIPADIEYIS